MTKVNSVLEVKVSAFRSYNDAIPAKNISLLDWLNDTHFKERVLKIRSSNDKATRDKLKALLPAITVSGTFGKRNRNSLIQHSGLICIDIDAKDNLHIANYSELKQELITAPFVAYCGLSVSGTGYFLIIPILYPEKHEQHFEKLRQLFDKVGIIIDKSGKDVCRLRGISYDDAAYFNHQAVPFKYFADDKKVVLRPTFPALATPESIEQAKMKVEKCLDEIDARKLDMTQDYNVWVSIGYAFANAFEEEGRDYFHRVSQYHEEYDWDYTDQLYSDFLESKKGRNSIGTFFFVCEKHGISIKG